MKRSRGPTSRSLGEFQRSPCSFIVVNGLSFLRPHWAVQYDCWSKSMVCVCCLRSYYQCMVLGILQNFSVIMILDEFMMSSVDLRTGSMNFPSHFGGSKSWEPQHGSTSLRWDPHWISQGRWIGKWWFSGATSRGGCFWHKLGGDGRYGWQLTPVETVTKLSKTGRGEEKHSIAIQGGFAWVCVLF